MGKIQIRNQRNTQGRILFDSFSAIFGLHVSLFLIPIMQIVYIVFMSGGLSDMSGLLEHLSFIILFEFILFLLLLIRNPLLRVVVPLAFTMAFSFCYYANLVYFRFFGTWIQAGTFRQWRDTNDIVWSAVSLTRYQDVLFLFLLPTSFLVGNILYLKTHFRSTKAFALPACAIILYFSIQYEPTGLQYSTGSVNPVIDLPRQVLLLTRLKMDMESVYGQVGKYFPTDAWYEYAGDDSYPLMKIPSLPVTGNQLPKREEGMPLNVVLIVLESVRTFQTEVGQGPRGSFTPNLDELAKSGVHFMNYYASGMNTVNGEFSMISSFHPDYFGGPVYVDRPETRIKTLPEILRDEGYHTIWINSFTAEFGNELGYLSSHGYSRVLDSVPQIYRAHDDIGWGPADEDLFSYAVDVLNNMNEPFFAEILTLSNHHPWDESYPMAVASYSEKNGYEYTGYSNGTHYTDYALGTFIEKAKKLPFFRNTLFIITADHGVGGFFKLDDSWGGVRTEEALSRIPLILYSPEHIKPKKIMRIGSQVDMAPTVLDLLGIVAKNSFSGRSLLTEGEGNKYVLLSHNNKWNMRIGNKYCYSIRKSLEEAFPWPMYQELDGHDGTHVCFETEKDLLKNVEKKDVRMLSPKESGEIRSFAEKILRFNRSILTANMIWPEGVRRSLFLAHRLIGHAFGNIGGISGTNSLEAFTRHYKLGRRIFEVELSLTSDNEIVCSQPAVVGSGAEGYIREMTRKQFMETVLINGYTPLDIDGLITLMRKHRDMYIVADSNGITFSIISDLVNKAKQSDPGILSRIIPQVYSAGDYSDVISLYPFQEIVYAVNGTKWDKDEVIAFMALHPDVTALNIPKDMIDSKLIDAMTGSGKYLFANTVNDPNEATFLKTKGIYGFYTDNLYSTRDVRQFTSDL